jgi:hypothetical protein
MLWQKRCRCVLVFLCTPVDTLLNSSRHAVVGHPVVAQASAPMLSALAFFFVMTSYYIVRPVGIN